MGIRESMQASFGALFDTTFAEAVSQFTGTYLGPGVYDPVTEATTSQPVNYTGRGVGTRYKADMVDGARIKSTDTKLLVLANEVTDTPAVGHTINMVDPITKAMTAYSVLDVATDPVSAHIQIQLRAT